MKIKKQFTLLVTFIIAIPLICIFFILLENYLSSSNRYLISGYKEANELEKENFDYADAIEILKLIPEDVETCLIAIDENKIIYNSFPEVNISDPAADIWKRLKATSDRYFYQFTSPSTRKNTILVTRIPRIKPKPSPSVRIVKTLLVIFSVCIIACIIFIFFISRTIFQSIMKIKNETKKIANGNLNEEITTDSTPKNQNEIMSILESIEKMRRSLYEAENRKNKFIMGISHDLRTPVAIIKGYTEAITDNVITSEKDIKEALNLVEIKTEQLEEMINDLINFTKLNSYELKEQFTPYPVTDLIKTFAKESELSANVFNRKVVCNIDLQEKVIIPLNKQLILRAFENIFSNAMRYTKDGDEIKISAVENHNHILLKIADTGVGIKDDDLPHIFDLFYKSSKSRQGKSMGIGLSVVKSVIDAHGWGISVESEIGKGTCFSIEIPVPQLISQN